MNKNGDEFKKFGDECLNSYKNWAPTILAVIIGIIGIVVLIWTYNKCTSKCPVCSQKESFCACRNMADKRCPDPNVLNQLYTSGKLTEFTDFAKIQKENPAWKTDMPYDRFLLEQNKA